MDGPFNGQHNVEDLRVFEDGKVVYVVEATSAAVAAKPQRLSYEINIGPDEMRHLAKLLDSPEIRALPSEIEPKTRPIDFFWQKSLEIDRSGTTQKTHIENFYPFLNEHGPAYPNALIELECSLKDIESTAAKRPKEEDNWCRSLLSTGTVSVAEAGGAPSAQVQQACRDDQARPGIVAGKGWGPVQIGADLKTVDSSLGKGLQGSKYSDGYLREYPPNGIEVSFENTGNTVRAIYFYNGQRDSGNIGAFCGQVDNGINWRSTADDVKKVYGRPNSEFSGADSGGTWERLVFAGIDFRFESGKMVRIGIPGR
ncbi:MAG TPA: hypothetical protein VN776_12965 [Terracidiphilus sp.]|nr:hypothetical protein [Terracidiphilus sp.]